MLSRKCSSKARLDGRTAVVTGANSGIGKATALDLFRRGGRIILACRDLKRAQEAVDDIRRQTSGIEGLGELVIVHLDLSSLASVRECAKNLLRTEKQIHLLINNAGMCFIPKRLTKDGFEMHLGVNHFGHFLLTSLLLPCIIRSAPARIITVSSKFHTMDPNIPLDDVAWENQTFSTFKAYSQSKLANILFAKELANKLQGTGVTTYAVEPGVVSTDALRYANESMFQGARWLLRMFRPLAKTATQGAQTTIYCAVDEKVVAESGFYYGNCRLSTPSAAARDPERAKMLWDASVRLVGLENWDPFTAGDVLPSDCAENTKL